MLPWRRGSSGDGVAVTAAEIGADGPDFLGLGAQKCGTTWLDRRLRDHPDLWLPPQKEVHYFDAKAHLRRPLALNLLHPGARHSRRAARRDIAAAWHRTGPSLAHALRHHLGLPTTAWYRRVFVPGRGRVRGEITPEYATIGADGAAAVDELLPFCRYIFLLRSPIERDWSAEVMTYKLRGDRLRRPALADLEALRHNPKSAARSDMIGCLTTWREVVGDERLFVGFIEDIEFNPEGFLGSVYRFLGVDDRSAGQTRLGRKVRAASGATMPLDVADHLARAHQQQLERLDGLLGGYATLWRHVAAWIMAQPPAADAAISYPLYHLPIWREGADDLGIGSPPAVQSRPLAQ